jgi:chromosome segregation ATPase
MFTLRQENAALCEKLDAIEEENNKLENEILSHVKATSQIDGSGPKENGGLQRLVLEATDSTRAKSEELRKIQHIVLSTIARNSSKLACMMSDRCDSEMERTRRIDKIIAEEEQLLSDLESSLNKIAEYQKESYTLRAQYDDQLSKDFSELIELGLMVESLENELVSAENEISKKENQKKLNQIDPATIAPIIDSTSELRERVAKLAADLEATRSSASNESKRLTENFNKTRQNQKSGGRKFQSDIKSLFKDFQTLRERIDRTESSLEKANTHYDLDEEEIVNVVSPIIDSLDGIRDEIDAVESEADQVFYGCGDIEQPI